MSRTTFSSLILACALSIAFNSCDTNDSMMSSQSGKDPVLITPAENQQDVRLDGTITLTFATTVDRVVVENDFHLISQRDMTDSLCPISTTMNHGMMSAAMMDSMKMNHLMRQHAISGRLSWQSGTQCTFRPDSMMSPNTQHMIHLGMNMMRMMQSRMSDMTGMNMMSGHGQGMMQDHMMTHFRTMDTVKIAGGHASHHP